jgi:hypothetical protein
MPYHVPHVFKSTSEMSVTIATDGDTASASLEIVVHEETTTCGDPATIVFESGPPLGGRLDSALSVQQGYGI